MLIVLWYYNNSFTSNVMASALSQNLIETPHKIIEYASVAFPIAQS